MIGEVFRRMDGRQTNCGDAGYHSRQYREPSDPACHTTVHAFLPVHNFM
jgi:hypothetical protein